MPPNKPLPPPPHRAPKMLSKMKRNTTQHDKTSIPELSPTTSVYNRTKSKLVKHNKTSSIPGLSPIRPERNDPKSKHAKRNQTSSIPGLSPTSSEYSPTSPTRPANNKGQVAKYLSDHDSDEETKSVAKLEPQVQRQDMRPSLKGLTFRKSPRENLLERRLARLDQENTELRRQLRIEEANSNTEKDELITLLQNQNQRYKHQIRQQNGVVAQIANKISTAFQEYQGTVGHMYAIDDDTASDAAGSITAEIESDSGFDAADRDDATATTDVLRYYLSSDSDSDE
ncbi:hypothetical protein F4678DRAFT_223941 [Xylaria arbuscula]|nr:hypothetical protein F4678DRAFT_223941 [Xylaria arbuscula]